MNRNLDNSSQANLSEEYADSSLENISVSDSGDSISNEENNTMEEPSFRNNEQPNKANDIRSVLLMQLIILALLFLVTFIYGWFHNLPV